MKKKVVDLLPMIVKSNQTVKRWEDLGIYSIAGGFNICILSRSSILAFSKKHLLILMLQLNTLHCIMRKYWSREAFLIFGYIPF